MKASLQPLNFTLPVGETDKAMPVSSGLHFAVKEATEGGSFQVAFDDGPFISWDVGMQAASADGVTPFQQVRFRNTGSIDIAFQCIVGSMKVTDSRFTLIANRAGQTVIVDNGTDATGIAQPAGGVGVQGWLSGLYSKVSTLLTQLPATLGRKGPSASLAVVHASVTAAITSAQTANPGTGWTAFAAAACTSLVIANNTGTTIEYRRGAAGTSFPIFTGQVYVIEGITDASQIDVRRVDTSNVQVTVDAETKS